MIHTDPIYLGIGVFLIVISMALYSFLSLFGRQILYYLVKLSKIPRLNSTTDTLIQIGFCLTITGFLSIQAYVNYGLTAALINIMVFVLFSFFLYFLSFIGNRTYKKTGRWSAPDKNKGELEDNLWLFDANLSFLKAEQRLICIEQKTAQDNFSFVKLTTIILMAVAGLTFGFKFGFVAGLITALVPLLLIFCAYVLVNKLRY
jgi:hypothetical protein